VSIIILTIDGASLSLLCGGIGLFCQLLWPLMRTRLAILRMQSGIGLGYGSQYALLDGWSGAMVAWLGATQNLVLVMDRGDRLRPVIGRLFLPIVAIACALTWSGWPSVFAFFACSLVMLARLQTGTIRLRAMQLMAAPFGAAYDLSVGAMPALCGAVVSAVIAALALAYEINELRRAEQRSG